MMHLTWFHEDLALQTPLRIARSTTTHKEAVVVCLHHAGCVGYGEALASTYYAQSRAAIDTTLGVLAAEIALLADPWVLLGRLDALAAQYADQPATIAALDAATHDWLGMWFGQPLYRLLGADPHSMPPTAFTIGIGSPHEVTEAAQAAVQAGYPILKLKVGLPTLDEDVALVAALRTGAPTTTLYLDANGGWAAGEAQARIAALAAFGPALIEQPIAPGQLTALQAITAAAPCPIIADEDALDLHSVARLWGVVTGINIKLPKCGGVRQAHAMIHAARAGGLEVMLGCMVGSSLSLAPAVHLGPLADYLDLDGHLLLAADPWTGLGGQLGRLTLPHTPGLGVARRPTHDDR